MLHLTNFSDHGTYTYKWIFFLAETPPPGYISEDGETSDQQLNQSMDTGKFFFFTTLKTGDYQFCSLCLMARIQSWQ